MVHQKQRPRLPWGKRTDDSIKDIGSPVLVETTLHKDWLDNLPDVKEYEATKRSTSAPTHTNKPAVGKLNPKLMKDLPEITAKQEEEYDQRLLHPIPEIRPASSVYTRSPEFSHEFDTELQHRLRPVSEVPTASSVYTRSPDFPFGFDPESQVAPLFSGKSNPKLDTVTPSTSNHATDGDSHRSGIDDSVSTSTVEPISSEKTLPSGATSLGVITTFHSGGQARGLWQGASGQTTQLTPITATPVTMSHAGSVSPLRDSHDEDYFPYLPSDEMPTPRAHQENLAAQLPPEQPTTPKTTPALVVDAVTPDSRRSPNYRQPLVSRFSWTTYATDTDRSKPANNVSTPKTVFSFGTEASPTPPQHHQRGKSSSSSVETPSSVVTGKATEIILNPATKITGPNRDSYGKAITYPGVRYPALRSRPESPASVDTSPKPSLDKSTKRLSPIMSRRHPMASLPKASPAPSEIVNPKTRDKKAIKRKPTPSAATQESAASSLGVSSSPPPPADTDKSLPHTPATLSSIDHITLLQSELSTLSLQRYNLTKRINRLNETFSPKTATNPMILDLEVRRQLKADIAKLESELAQVRQTEHATGLRLMRAQKRRDQEAPSALWVRRVTSVTDN